MAAGGGRACGTGGPPQPDFGAFGAGCFCPLWVPLDGAGRGCDVTADTHGPPIVVTTKTSWWEH